MTAPDFDRATTIVAEDSDGETRTWRGRLSSDWSIGQVPNGGYTAAVALSGLLAHTGCESALSMTSHYYRPTLANEDFVLHTEIQRRGRSMVHADATLIQDDKVRLRCVGVFGRTPDGAAVFPSAPVEIPRPEDCPTRDPLAQGLNMSLLQSLEVRLHDSSPSTDPHSHPRVDGWVRFRDGRANDARALCLFADAFPPAVLTAIPETGWVPTIEMTTHIRAAAAAGWIRGEVTSSNVRKGFVIENVRLWDSRGELVVEARQLALLRT